jgi:thiol-disulfide isomerase/thioredoxin
MALVTVGCSSSEPAAGNGASTGAASDAYQVVPVSQRNTAPSLDGTPVSGPTASPKRLRGDVVVLNFWASWCPPCRAESPILERVFQHTSPQGVAFVGVDEKDSRSAAETFTRDKQLTYPSVFDPDGSVAAAWPGASGLPYTFILDRNGRIAVRIVGGVTQHQLQVAVLQIASEAKAG